MNIQTANLSLTLGDDPREALSLENLLTGQSLCSGGRQFMMLRLKDEVSEPYFLDTVTGVEREGDRLSIRYAGEHDGVSGGLTITSSEHGLRFDLSATAHKPVWLAEWRLSNIAVEETIVPALGGQVLTSDMPVGTVLSYKYPFWWNAQFAVGRASGGGLWLRTMEAEPRFKMLRVKKESSGFAWAIGFEADGPLHEHTISGTWFLDGFEGDWRVPVQRHRAWLEQTFGLVPFAEHPHFPSWVNDIDVILEIWGMHREIPEPIHPYHVMIDRLRNWAGKYPPERTLLYLPGFAQHGIDSHAPNYDPAPKLGGTEGFRRLVDAAHEMGYRVMIHTNVLAMTYAHPKFPEFAKYQVVDVHGRKQGWAMDIDGDWLTEPYFAYMNPGYEAWGDYMAEVLGELIDEFGLDAVFLDQTLLAFNVSEGPNFVAGMRNHIERLQRAFPKVLFGGEGLHEQNVAALPFAQIHGIDSIAEVQNMDDRQPWRRAHPVNVELFGRYTKYVAHLLTRHPTHHMFELQQTAYEELGIVPAMALYGRSDSFDHPGVDRVIEHARKRSRSPQQTEITKEH